MQAPLARSSDAGKALPHGYGPLLAELKARIRAAAHRSALAVNSELVLLYWRIGREILERQRAQGWGAKVIDRLSADLRSEFPEMSGLSPRNLKYMRAFAKAHPDAALVQEVLARITWYHNITLLEKVKEPRIRLWYVHRTIEHGWSRNALVRQIEARLHERQGRALTNFDRTLPPKQSDLAREILKDPYRFDFLELGRRAMERDVEQGLMDDIQRFLLELGAGFAFVGRQVAVEVGGEAFYVDLLFYHLQLRCFVVIDLKRGAFRPEDAGKMNFYLSAVDDALRHPDDRPSIGLVLCRTRRRLVAEYALRDLGKPIGVSSYELRLVESLPEGLEGRLPSVQELAQELGRKVETENGKECRDEQ